MAGILQALLLRPSERVRDQAAAVGAPLVALAPRTGLVLLPVTDEVHDRIAGGARADDPVLGFYPLSSGLADWARSLSIEGPVGYIHLEFHGGTGFHAAVGWLDGAIGWGPRFTANAADEADEHYEVLPADRRADMAINGVLRWLGVDRGDDIDEFLAADLIRHRWTEQWAARATS